MNTSPLNTPRSTSRFLRLVIALTTMALVAVSCSSDASDLSATAENTPTPSTAASPTSEPTPAPTVEATTPTAPAVDPEPATAPDSTSAEMEDASDVLDWVVELLNSDNPDPDDIAARFSPAFLEVVPIEQIMGLLPQLSSEATGPWSIATADASEFTATAVLQAEGSTSLNADLLVSSTEPHLIEGLRFSPAIETPTISNAQEYEAELAAFAPLSRVGIFEVVEGECATVLDLGAEEIMPIGSIFKLWILAELGHQVAAGDAAWDETFAVQDELKSSPDGTIFNLAPGTELTLRKYAEEMISISDNGATDHLLARVGRQQVEAAMTASGVAAPELNIPFLAATDLFRIKFHPDAPNASDYRELDQTGRRAMLEAFEGTVAPWVADPASFPMLNGDGVALSQPRDHDLEWFATPLDLCRTHTYLAEMAEQPGLEPIADILRLNADAGVQFDETVWSDLRFKGGSEQGIAAVAWRMERRDGRVFVLAGGVENPGAPISAAAAVGLLQQGAKLAADVS